MAFSTLVANQSQTIAVVIRIDGVGENSITSGNLTNLNSDGRIRFCSRIPDYAASLSEVGWYKDTLVDFPSEVATRGDELGGITRLGSLSFSLVDRDDWLTSNLRIEGVSTDNVNGSVTSTATTVNVRDGTNFAANDVIWIGQEAMRISSIATNALTVTRGLLNTKQTAHNDTAEVFKYVNFLRGRFVTMSLVDYTESAESSEVDIGSWIIDAISYDPLMNEFRFDCSSRLRAIDRMVPRRNSGTLVVERDVTSSGYINIIRDANYLDHHSNYGYLRLETDEVVEWTGAQLPNLFIPTRRGVAGTQQKDIEAGMTGIRVFVADTAVGGPSFRWSDPDSDSVETTRGGSNWTNSSHWIDIVLNIMTSGGDSDTIANSSYYDASKGNWAQLPIGFGAAIPHSDIDIDGFLDLKQRTADYLFPNFVYGHKQMALGELIEEEFLKPIGAYLGVDKSTGKITAILPRLPVGGDSVLTLGTDEMLCTPVGGGSYEPIIDASYPLSSAVGAVGFVVGPREVQVSFKSSNASWGLEEEFRGEVEPVILRVPSADHRQQAFLERVAFKRLFRQYRPQMRVRITTSLESYDANMGDVVTVDFPQMPDLSTGTRGRTDVLCEVISNGIAADQEMGAHVNLDMIAYVNSINIGLIAPAAGIASYDDTNPNDVEVTVDTNNFTASNAQGSLPSTDAAAFEVGDICYLYNSVGGYISAGGSQEVIEVSGNVIHFDGNFSSQLSTSYFLRLAHWDAASSGSKAEYVYTGDDTTHNVPSDGDLFYWGEP